MTYSIGDPNHVGVHNDLAAEVAAQAVRLGAAPPVLPDVAKLGDTGHVDDHNLITAAIAALAALPPAGPPKPIATGGTESTYVGDGTNGELGVTYKLHTFTADGSLVVSKAGEADVLVVGGGQAVGSDYYPGASVVTGRYDLPVGTIPVKVGAASAREVEGGGSSLGEIAAANGSLVIAPGGASNVRGAGWAFPSSKPGSYWRGYPSRITGALVEYGQAGGPSPAPTTAPTSPGSSGNPPRAGIVIVRYKV
jgi:hypothetical protein